MLAAAAEDGRVVAIVGSRRIAGREFGYFCDRPALRLIGLDGVLECPAGSDALLGSGEGISRPQHILGREREPLGDVAESVF